MIEKEKIYSRSTNKLLSLYLSFNNEVDWIHNESFANDYNLYSLSLGFEAVAAPITRIIESNSIMFTPGTYHKYGIRTSCYKWYSNMYDNNTIAALDSSIAFQWTKLYSATPKFNCHSYAWISSNYNNQFWLDSPSTYMSSSDITYVGYNVTPQNGDIVVMYNRFSGAISHSAVICSAPSGGSGIYTKSKIGGLGVYMAPLSELKMYYSCDNYDVYRIN